MGSWKGIWIWCTGRTTQKSWWEVLCHLSVSIYEWTIAFRPYVFAVKSWGMCHIKSSEMPHTCTEYYHQNVLHIYIHFAIAFCNKNLFFSSAFVINVCVVNGYYSRLVFIAPACQLRHVPINYCVKWKPMVIHRNFRLTLSQKLKKKRMWCRKIKAREKR